MASNSVLLDLQAGSAQNGWGHVSDDQAVVPESRFIIDDEGMVVFQDVLRGSVEEEVASFMAKSKFQQATFAGCGVTTVARYVLFGPSIGYANYEIMFASSMWNQTNLYVRAQSRALHDADCARREGGSDCPWGSSVVLQKHVEPQLRRRKNLIVIDKSVRLLLTSGGPISVNKVAIGDSLAAKRALNIYYNLSCAETLFREIVLHHSNAAFLSDSVVLYLFFPPPASQKMSNKFCYVLFPIMWSSSVALHAITCFASRLPIQPPIVEDIVLSPPIVQLRLNIFHALEQNEEFVSLSIDATLKICMTVQGQASYRSSAAVRNAAWFGDGEAWKDSPPALHWVWKTVRKRTVPTVPRLSSFKSKWDAQRA